MNLRLLTQEKIDAYEADPRTIEYRAYQERAAKNARLHCTCGRFVKPGRMIYGGIAAECSRCGPVLL